MKICVIGLGYIGLPTAAMFAKSGHEVVGVDLSEKVVVALNRGEVTIEEPELPELVKSVVEGGNLKASLTPVKSDVFIISVPTPITKDKSADMSYVKSATASILPYIESGNLVILESTSPPKTVENIMCPILEESGLKMGEELFVAHSPERVLPGKILQELENNDRVVGGINRQSAEKVRELYKSFVKAEFYLTDATTAEMSKLLENTYRDVNIALANEIAKISETLGIDAWEVIRLANRHPRVNIHQPGPGVGGHCIAVDPWFIVEKAPSLAHLIRLGRETNDNMPEYVTLKCEHILGTVQDKKILMLGITYKPNVDDVRESPVIDIVEKLKNKGADISVYDPHVKKYKYDCVYDEYDLIVLGVNHDEFKNIDFSKSSCTNILDTRNFLDRSKLEGKNYVLLGAGE